MFFFISRDRVVFLFSFLRLFSLFSFCFEKCKFVSIVHVRYGIFYDICCGCDECIVSHDSVALICISAILVHVHYRCSVDTTEASHSQQNPITNECSKHFNWTFSCRFPRARALISCQVIW